MSDSCPVCDTVLTEPIAATTGDASAFVCPRCGGFRLSSSLLASLPDLRARDPDAWAKLSFVLRGASERNDALILTTDTAKAVIARPLPRPREQADLLLRWLAEHVSGPGETICVEYGTHGAIIGSQSYRAFRLVLDHLFSVGLLTGALSKTIGESGAHATLSFMGWEHYESLRRGSAVYRKAFMAMKFDDDELNSVVESTFKPQVRAAGFELLALNDEPKAGLIDDRLRVEIQASDFLVADLTHDNLGAYWEAGFAEGLGKPVIYTCSKAKFEAGTHFDTNHHLTIVWDPAAPADAGLRLKATVRATLPHLARLQD